MSFTPLLDHIYAFVSAIRISFYFKTNSTNGWSLQQLRVNITELKFENQWYSYNDFISKLINDYDYTTELAQTLIYQLTDMWGMPGWEVYATSGNNDGRYVSARGLLNCDIKLGDSIAYNSSGDTFTIRYISDSLLSALISKLRGSYTTGVNRTYTYNLEFTPTRIYIYRSVKRYINEEQTTYQLDYYKYKTINVTNFGIVDLGSYTDLRSVDAVMANKTSYYTLPENIVSCIPLGFNMQKMTTEVYMKVLSGSSSNVGGTYLYDDADFCISNLVALCTERPTQDGDMYSNLRTYKGYNLNESWARYIGLLNTGMFTYTAERYAIYYTYDRYYFHVNDTLQFNSFINYNENDDTYSVTFTHTHSIRDRGSGGIYGEQLPSNALVCSVYVDGNLLDVSLASEATKQYTYTFSSTSERKSISVVVTYNANITLPEISDNCTYTKSFNYTSQQYLLVHSVDAGNNFAFKVEDSNVYIGNVSRYAEGMICVKGLAVNTKREGYGIQVDNVLLFPDENDKTRFSKALIIDSENVKGTDLDDVFNKINTRLNNSEYELYRMCIGLEGNGSTLVGGVSTPYIDFMFVALYKHPQFFNGGTYVEFASTLPEPT